MNQVPGQPYLGYNGGYGGTQVIRVDDSETIKVLRDTIAIQDRRIAKYEEDQKLVAVSRRAWVNVSFNLAKTNKTVSEKRVEELYEIAKKLCQKHLEKVGMGEFIKNAVIFDIKI